MALFTENLVPFGGAELLQIELESQFLISSKMQKACGACLRALSSSMRKRPKYQLYQYWPSVSTNSFGIQLWLYTFCMIVHILHSVSEYSLSLETALFTSVFLFLPVLSSSPFATLFNVFPFRLCICWYHEEPLKFWKSRVCYQVSYTAVVHFFVLLRATVF